MITHFFRFTTLLLLLCALIPSVAHALTIKNIRFGEHSDKTRLVVELDQKTEFRTFALGDPYRIVVDLPAFTWRADNITKPKTGDVKDIRQGPYAADFGRLVIDLQKPTAIRSAFLLPGNSTSNQRLVIDFETISPAAFAKRSERIFGSLKIQDNIDENTQTPKPETLSELIAQESSATQSSSTTIKPTHKPAAPQNFAKTHSPLRKAIVVIDPGHGGVDPGAIGANKVREKDITFATAKELKKQLEATGLYTVYLTRNSDKYIKLHKRVAYARDKDADLFMSIHADSINKPNIRGASVYTLSDKASDAQTARLAARENQADLIAGVDLSHEDKVVANILLDLSMRDTMNQSKFLANTLVNTMSARGMSMLTRPHRYAGFAVLKAPDVPSVLVEIGFVSNSSEAKLLTSNTYRRKVAASLVDGINVYFSKVKRNNKS